MITSGTLLIQQGTVLPESVQFKGEPPANGWTTVGSGAEIRQLKADLDTAGWTYFYMGAIKQRAFGTGGEKRMASAMKGIAAQARLGNCNSLEIDEVAAHSFLGISYLSVSAHCCHIQKAALFASGSA